VELLSRLPAFLVAVVAIAAVPGPAFALIVRHSSLGGFRAGAPVVLGTELGLYVWIIAAGAGLAALVAASHLAYLVLRVVSASVLLWIGGRFLFAVLSKRPEPHDLELPGRSTRGGFAMGTVTNLANPKVGSSPLRSIRSSSRGAIRRWRPRPAWACCRSRSKRRCTSVWPQPSAGPGDGSAAAGCAGPSTRSAARCW
jgi:hypothetical protein